MEETVTAAEQTAAASETAQRQPSLFTGGMLANFGIALATKLATLLTLGIAYPFLVCWRERWVCKHTYINGYKLRFDGNGMQLFGKYIIWLLLSVITLGIYYVLCVAVRLEAWRTKHTHFDGNSQTDDEHASKFDGKWYELFGVKFLTNLVTMVTLSFGMYWAHCYKKRWLYKHKTIDGCRLYFTGTGLQYFAKCIVWVLLTVVTFGIYGLWLSVKSLKWTVMHTEAHTLPQGVSGNGDSAQDASGNGEPSCAPVDTQAIKSAEEAKPKKQIHTFSVVGLIICVCYWVFVLFMAKFGYYMRYEYDGLSYRILFSIITYGYERTIALSNTALMLICGLIFSILGLIRARKHKENIVVPIVGTVLNILPLLLAIIFSYKYFSY